MVIARKRVGRPTRVADGRGVLRSYAELLVLLQNQLSGDSLEPRRVLDGGVAKPALNWRQERIEDVTNIVAALCKVHIPFPARNSAITALTCLRHQLKVLNWPDHEATLRQQLDGIIRRLKHTTRRPGIAAKIKRKIKPASSLPAPSRRRTA